MKRLLLFIIFAFLIIGCHKRLPVKDYTLNDPRLTKRYPRYFTATSFVRYRHTVYKKVTPRKANYFARFSIPENYDELKDFYSFDKLSRGKIRKELGEKDEEIALEEKKTETEKELQAESKEIKDKKISKETTQKAEPKSDKESEKAETDEKRVEKEVKHTIDFELPQDYINLTHLGLPDYYRTFLSDKNERVVEVLYIEKDLMFQFIDRKLAYIGEVSDLELTLLEEGYPQKVFIRQDKEGNHVVTLIYKNRFGIMQRIYTICDGVREYYQEVP